MSDSKQEAPSLSHERRAFVGASWLAIFKVISQVFAWSVTIFVARLLEPADYGLMAMATIVPGYAMKLGELGLGPAIVQRLETTHHELSSVFWFGVGVSLLLAITCYELAPFTAWLFDEPRLVPLTHAIAVIFLIQGMQVVPISLLKKRLEFKRIGQIEVGAVIIASSTMFIMANLGAGVWTLIFGYIAISFLQMVFSLISVRWLPFWHYKFSEVRAYIKFGVLVTLQGTLFYVYKSSDAFFAGRAWQPGKLGLYTFALQLAQIPSEKISVLINQVAFATFSLIQNDADRFRAFYLNVVNLSATLVLPLFVGGFLVGGDVVDVLLGDQWAPMAGIFEWLCLGQIVVSLNAVNNFVHNAQGRPMWGFVYTLVCAILVPLSFFIVAPYGLNAILVPWFTTYILISASWIAITAKSVGVTFNAYFRAMSIPILGTLAMAAAVELFGILASELFGVTSTVVGLLVKIAGGASTYFLFLWTFDKRVFALFRSLRGR